jgi:hypothetical protein
LYPVFFFVVWAIEITRASLSIPVAFYAQPRAQSGDVPCNGASKSFTIAVLSSMNFSRDMPARQATFER